MYALGRIGAQRVHQPLAHDLCAGDKTIANVLERCASVQIRLKYVLLEGVSKHVCNHLELDEFPCASQQ